MHNTKQYTKFVTLFNRDGAVATYASVNAAYKALGMAWIEANLGEHFVCFRGYSWTNPDVLRYDYADFIMRDDAGKAITVHDFYAARPRKSRHYRYRWTWNGIGPVPGTGVSHFCLPYRAMKTYQAKRLAECFKEEGEPPIRAKRRASNVPSSYDDRTRSTYGNQNWKRHRQTQYK